MQSPVPAAFRRLLALVTARREAGLTSSLEKKVGTYAMKQYEWKTSIFY